MLERFILYSVLSLVALHASGCGTIASKHQYISVDSQPRGVKAGDAKGILLGRTPLFIKAKRNHVLTLKSHTAGLQRYPCQYQWTRSPLENSPLLVPGSAGGVVGAFSAVALGMAYDLFSGAAFNCPSQIQLKVEGTPPAELKYCPGYLVMAPGGVASMAKKELEAYWMDYAKRKHTCARQVNQDRSLAWLRRLNLGSGLKELKEEKDQIAKLGYQTGASHVVKFRLDEVFEDAQLVWADVIDLHALKRKRPVQLFLPSDSATAEEDSGTGATRFLRRSLRFLPETFAIGIGGRFAHASDQGDGSNSSENEDSLSFMHKEGFPAMKFMSVSHPDAFGPWAWDVNLGPSLGLDLMDPADEPGEMEIPFTRAALHVIGSVTGHTPLGALTAGIGGGPAYYYFSGDVLPYQDNFGGELVFTWNYTAFTAERFVTRFFMDFVLPSGNIACGKLDNVVEVGLLFGYYFDAIDTWTRDLF